MACLLCVRNKRYMFEIFSEEGKTLAMADILAKHFWFELKPDDATASKAVCKQCWLKTLDFHLFYLEVELNQPVFYQDLETKCEVDEEDATILGGTVEKITEDDVKFEPSFDADEPMGDLSDDDVDSQPLFQQNSETKYEENIEDASNLMVVEAIQQSEIVEIVEKITEDDVNFEPSSDAVEPMDEVSDDYGDDDEDEEDEKLCSKPSTFKRTKTKTIANKSSNPKMTKKQRSLKNNDEQHKIMEYCKMMCDLCNTSFKDWSDVKTHYRKEHKVKGYIFCTCCNEKYSRRFRILDHLAFKANPEAFKCEICGKNFQHRDTLQNHKDTHKPAEERIFKCDKCDKCYVKKAVLSAHIRTRHISDEDKKFVCGECGSRFATQALLNSHVRNVHEGAYIHVCEICAKVFKSKALFEQHKLNNHAISSLPKVQCKNCGSWLRESSMPSHIHRCQKRQEKGVHVCDICGKESPNARALQSHKRYAHLAQKLYKCSVCDKAFKRALTLKEHSTIHSGEVLYSCTYCPKTFNSNANMHAHRKKIHKAQWEELRSKGI